MIESGMGLFTPPPLETGVQKQTGQQGNPDQTGQSSSGYYVSQAYMYSLAAKNKCRPHRITDPLNKEPLDKPRPAKRSLDHRATVSTPAKRPALDPSSPVLCKPAGQIFHASSIHRALSKSLNIEPVDNPFLAGGSFGRVEQWQTPQTLASYAVKISCETEGSGRKSWKSLSKLEANSLLCNEHENIVKTHAILLREEKTSNYCLITDLSQIPKDRPHFEVCAVVGEYINGRDLCYAMYGGPDRNDKPSPECKPSPELAVKVLAPVSRAVAHMHSNGLIYRDLKPDNIMIEDIQGAFTPKLIDFGFCKQLRVGDTTSSFKGTPDYRAPEVLLLEGTAVSAPYGHKVDAWSLGMSMIELICGKTITDLDFPSIKDDKITSIPARIKQFGDMSDSQKKRFLNQQVHSFKGHALLLDLIVALTRHDPDKRLSVAQAAEFLSKLADQ